MELMLLEIEHVYSTIVQIVTMRLKPREKLIIGEIGVSLLFKC